MDGNMTIEEKAKAYDEALEKVRPMYQRAKENDNPSYAVYEDLFPELKESEDERIRKGLIQHLKELRNWKAGTMSPIKVPAHYDAWITYLEKQNDANKEYWRGYREGKQEILDKYAEIEKQKEEKSTLVEKLRSISTPADENWFEIQKRWEKEDEQKPAEWSEEDELMRNACITFIKDEKFKGYERSYECIDWLKSLRPSWKPEGQQLDCLRHMINVSTVDKIDKQFVIDLYEQLKKL